MKRQTKSWFGGLVAMVSVALVMTSGMAVAGSLYEADLAADFAASYNQLTGQPGGQSFGDWALLGSDGGTSGLNVIQNPYGILGPGYGGNDQQPGWPGYGYSSCCGGNQVVGHGQMEAKWTAPAEVNTGQIKIKLTVGQNNESARRMELFAYPGPRLAGPGGEAPNSATWPENWDAVKHLSVHAPTTADGLRTQTGSTSSDETVVSGVSPGDEIYFVNAGVGGTGDNPLPGTNINSPFSTHSGWNVEIWEVVPEPSTVGLLLVVSVVGIGITGLRRYSR